MNILKLRDSIDNEQILVLDLCYLKEDLGLFVKNLSSIKANETLGRERVLFCLF